MRLYSIASGSSGNCIYIENETTHLLVDAGISGKRVIEGLEAIGRTLLDLDAVLITHEHDDHIKGLGVLLRKAPIPVYTTRATITALLSYSKLGKVDGALFHEIAVDQPFAIKDIMVDASAIWHDAADPVCYSFRDESGKISVATDMGDFDDYLLNKLTGSDLMLIESNHDVRMLEANQRYSYPLKKRILGPRGHLSNERSAELMVALMQRYSSRFIVLGHLSRDNNIPECAKINMENYLREAGFDRSGVEVLVAKRDTPSVDFSI